MVTDHEVRALSLEFPVLATGPPQVPASMCYPGILYKSGSPELRYKVDGQTEILCSCVLELTITAMFPALRQPIETSYRFRCRDHSQLRAS